MQDFREDGAGQAFTLDFQSRARRQAFFSEPEESGDGDLAKELAFAFAVSCTLKCEGVVKENAKTICEGIGRAESGSGKLDWNRDPKVGHTPLPAGDRETAEGHMKFLKVVKDMAAGHPRSEDVAEAFLFKDDETLLSWSEALKRDLNEENKRWSNKIKEAEEKDGVESKKAVNLKEKNKKREDQNAALTRKLLSNPVESRNQARELAKEQEEMPELKEVDANSVFRFVKDPGERTSDDWLDDFFQKLIIMVGQPGNSDLKKHVMDGLKSLPGCDYAAYKTNLEEERSNKWISPSTVVENAKLVLNGEEVRMQHGAHSAMDEVTFHQLICEKWPEIGERLPDLLNPYISRDLERLEQPGTSEEKKTSFGEEEFFRMMVQDPDASQKDQVVFIPGEPGMGKTTFAERLAQEWKKTTELSKKKTHPLHWVFLLTLQELVKLPDLTDKDGKIMTHKALRLDSHYKQRLFEENSDRAILLLDDLDEIPFDMQGKVLEWIKEARLSFGRVFITGRLGTQEIVHEHLSEQKEGSTLKRFYWILSFLPFTEKKQDEFYTAWWKQRLSEKDSKTDKLVKEYVKAIVAACAKNPDRFSFVGIPLLTHMVALIYEDKLKAFLSGEKMETIDESSDVDELYAKFIKKKWDIFREKYLGTVNFKEIIDNEEKLFLHFHTHLAFETMFRGRLQLSCRQSGSQCQVFYGQEEMRKMAMPYGIVKNQRQEDGGGDVFDFQHRSFSEYLAALFIVEGMVEEKTHTHRDANDYRGITRMPHSRRP